MKKSQLIPATALTMIFAASSNALADNDGIGLDSERAIIEAQTSIQITESYVHFADKTYISPIYRDFKTFNKVSEWDCFDMGNYQKDFSEQYQENDKNIRTLYQQGAIGSLKFAILIHKNDRLFGGVIKKMDAVNQYCTTVYEGATVTATAGETPKSEIK